MQYNTNININYSCIFSVNYSYRITPYKLQWNNNYLDTDYPYINFSRQSNVQTRLSFSLFFSLIYMLKVRYNYYICGAYHCIYVQRKVTAISLLYLATRSFYAILSSYVPR